MFHLRNPKNKLRRNQFGVVVSGPLIKNKTFWAFDYEGRREVGKEVKAVSGRSPPKPSYPPRNSGVSGKAKR